MTDFSGGVGPMGPSRPGFAQGTADTVPIASFQNASYGSYNPPGRVLAEKTGPPPSGSLSGGGQQPQASAQPQQQPQGGGNNFADQWRAAGNTGDVPVGWHGSQGGGGGGGQSIDFNALIAPAIQGYENYINTISGQQPGIEAGQNQQRNTQIGQVNSSLADQKNTLNQATTEQTTNANNAVEEAKRMYAEMSQGLMARYGTTTGTGGFLTEQLGQSTGRNVSQLRQGLAQQLQHINDTKTQVEQTASLAIQGVNDKFNQIITDSQNKLKDTIAGIKSQEGTLQANKAQMAANAIQHWQDQQVQLQAQREQEQNQYKIASLNALAQLEVYGNKMTGLTKGVTPVDFSNMMRQNLTQPGNIQNAPPAGSQPTNNTGSLPFQNNQQTPFNLAAGL